jgi:hypothetical protein
MEVFSLVHSKRAMRNIYSSGSYVVGDSTSFESLYEAAPETFLKPTRNFQFFNGSYLPFKSGQRFPKRGREARKNRIVLHTF